MTPDNSLLYLSYGQGPHINDTLFSLLTAFHFLPPDTPGYQYVLYTDDPSPFEGLGLTMRVFNAAQFQAWLGATDFPHRSKIEVIREQLVRFPGKSVFMDSDTYFQRSPSHLFDRIAPGRAVMHVRESTLGRSGEKIHTALLDAVRGMSFSGLGGKLVPITAGTMMWNTGVIGIDTADIGRMDEALVLTDQLWKVQKSRLMEQLSLSLSLGDLSLSEAMDVVFHYWPGHLRGNFRARIAPVLEQYRSEPLQIRASRAYEGRPRPELATAIKARVKHLMSKSGLPVSGVVRSA